MLRFQDCSVVVDVRAGAGCVGGVGGVGVGGVGGVVESDKTCDTDNTETETGTDAFSDDETSTGTGMYHRIGVVSVDMQYICV
jgi:hypothetical protein